MCARPLALLLLPAALTGCPALLSDWTIAGGPTDDASANAGGRDAAGDSSSGPSGSFDASIDADAGQMPGDAPAPDSTPEASDSGSSDSDSSDSGRDDSSPTDADLCNGEPVYLHHVGLNGLTWQDCVPTGTYNATQAFAACGVYANAIDAGAAAVGVTTFCDQRLDPDACSNLVQYVITPVFWFFQGGKTPGATGHVVVSGSYDSCPISAADPTWD